MATNSVSAPKKTSVFQKIARYPYLGLIIGLILILVVAWFLTPKMFTYQFTGSDKSLPITQTGLTEKASVIGRTLSLIHI